MKKALSALLVLAMVIACFAFTTSAAYSGSTEGIEKWWDRKTNPIEIKTAEELVFVFDYMAENAEYFAGKTLKLMNDIVINEGDFQDWGTNPPKYNWATRGQVELQGTFDGNNHSISGLYSSTFYNDEKCIPFEDRAAKTGACYAGLFSKMTGNATVKNLRLTNSYVEGPYGTAMIAGCASGNITFENVQIDTFKLYGTYAQTSDPNAKDEVDQPGPYEKHSDTGAFIGLGSGSGVTAKNCVVQGTVVGGGRFVGGYFGNLNKMHVEMVGCGFIGTLQSAYNQFYQGVNLFKENSGGLLARTDDGAETGSIFTDCFFAGNFNANDKSTTSGTIVGRCTKFTAENCTVSENVSFKFYDASKTTNLKGGETGFAHMATKDMVGKDCVVLLGLDDTIWTAVEGIGPMLKAHEDAAATITTAAKTTISMVDTPTKTTAKKTDAPASSAAATSKDAGNNQAQPSKTAAPTKKPSANTGDITVYMIAAVVVSAAAAVVVSKSRH